MAGHGWTAGSSYWTWRMPPITAQSKRLCIPIAPCVLVCSDVSLSRFSLIMLQLVGSVKEKTPVYSCPELSAENVACVNMGNRAVKTESHHNIALALRPCGPLPMLKSPCLAFFAAVQVRLQHVAFNSSSAHGTNCPMKLLQLPKSSFGCA